MNTNHHVKRAVCSIFAAVVLWPLAAHAAALPPDPNNAALLYYQAFLLRPEPDDAAEVLVYNTPQEQIYKLLLGGKFEPDADTRELITHTRELIDDLKERLSNRVAEPNEKMPDIERQFYFSHMAFYDELIGPYEKVGDVDPNGKIREYLEDCQETIKYAEAAAQLPQCNWGFRYSQGFTAHLPLVEGRSLAHLLEVSVAALAADGDYRAALGRCLTIRRFAHHVGDDTVLLYAVSVGTDGRSLRAIRHVLGRMPPDADAFGWLESQLATVRGAADSPARALQMDLALALQTMRADPNILAWVRNQLVESAKDNSAKNAIRSLTDEQLVARAREPYAKFLGSALEAMGSDMPYEQKHAEIQRMMKQLKDKFGSDPAASQVIKACSEQVVKFYGLHIRHRAHFNMVKSAVQIYLALAKTGRLPDTLPDGLPKDPYSGGDFEYEKAADGFVLRCRLKPIDEPKVQEYEFKVRK